MVLSLNKGRRLLDVLAKQTRELQHPWGPWGFVASVHFWYWKRIGRLNMAHLELIYPLKMVILHTYVSLPEGMMIDHILCFVWFHPLLDLHDTSMLMFGRCWVWHGMTLCFFVVIYVSGIVFVWVHTSDSQTHFITLWYISTVSSPPHGCCSHWLHSAWDDGRFTTLLYASLQFVQ